MSVEPLGDSGERDHLRGDAHARGLSGVRTRALLPRPPRSDRRRRNRRVRPRGGVVRARAPAERGARGPLGRGARATGAETEFLWSHVGRDVVEIVASDPGGTYRLVYTVKLGEVIYVLHAFQKKSKRGSETPKAELELIERCLRIARIKHENRDD